MAFIRRVRTASGATAVQIAEYGSGRRQRIVAHVGSAHTEAELGVLMARARAMLEDAAQGELDLGLTSLERRHALVPAGRDPALFDLASAPPAVQAVARGQVVGTASGLLYESLAGVYAALGFDRLGDEVFADLVLARVVEPTSLLDVPRVLEEMGRPPASYSTLRRTLRKASQVGGCYRDQIADLCFAHALTSGDVSLVLYDVTVRHEALVVRVEVRDHHRGRGRSRGRVAGGSLTGETSGRVGAAPTKPCRVSTAGWRERGERAEEVYARNRCHHLS